MFVNNFPLLLLSSPFYEAYISSDYLGKMIFLSIIATSIFSWSIFIYKIILINKIKANSALFCKTFQRSKNNPLNLDDGALKKNGENPYYDLYLSLKKNTIELLTKNRQFSSAQNETSYLSSSDVNTLTSHLNSGIDRQIKSLEKNIFVLSTIVGLAPLLGLLGTVWGILTTFAQMQSSASSSTNQMVLGGISLALTTTVLGLLSAMPAQIAYNYLKNWIGNFEIDMEGIVNEMLSSLEMQYKKVDLD